MHRGHEHAHDANGYGSAGHNHARPAQRAVQWQTPHAPGATAPEQPILETDLDLVEAAFVEGFLDASDQTSFLRLAQVPFEATAADGATLSLLRVEVEAVTDIGALAPQLGGGGFRYDPLPARMISRRRRLRLIYFDGQALRPLDLAEVRAIVPRR